MQTKIDLLYQHRQFISTKFDMHRGAAHKDHTWQRGTSKRN